MNYGSVSNRSLNKQSILVQEHQPKQASVLSSKQSFILCEPVVLGVTCLVNWGIGTPYTCASGDGKRAESGNGCGA